jgi:hypothetical protein
MVLVVNQGAQLTVSPMQHDFGKTAVKGTARTQVTLASAVGDTMSLSLTGPNTSDFEVVSSTQCFDRNYNPSASCPVDVFFHPSSLGKKTAILVVTNRRGQRLTVPLAGEGVEAMCIMSVVFCNYAHLYSGTFTWQITLLGPGSSSVTNVNVNVIKGKAACSGSEVVTLVGADTVRRTILGTGLIAVEFVEDPLYPVAYKISVACPTPYGPDRGSEPAALGRGVSMETPNEPAKVVAGDLDGNISYPAPEEDPVNGITGTVQIGWKLKK